MGHLVAVLRGETEAACRAFLGVELNEDGGLVPYDPRVVARLDRHNLRRHEFEGAAVRVFAGDVPSREEADVSVHAELRFHVRAHVGGPAEAGRVDHPLDAPVTGAADVDLGAAYLPVIGALDGRGERIHGHLA